MAKRGRTELLKREGGTTLEKMEAMAWQKRTTLVPAFDVRLPEEVKYLKLPIDLRGGETCRNL